jgi:ATPase subunit of ABC transporter with duplicated ATPase domains
VARDDRIWLSGRNGAGKTTLLQKLLAQMPEEVVHLPQELSAENARDALHDVQSLAPDARGRVLSLVAALSVDPGRLLLSAQPSPGEARKLLIATGLGRHLVLQPPLAHLPRRPGGGGFLID